LSGAEPWTLLKKKQKYLEMCWRRMEIIWTDCVKNEVLCEVKEEKISNKQYKEGRLNWICYFMRRNCLLKQVTEKTGGTVKRGRRCKQLLDDRMQKIKYCRLKRKH
jgi:hypothetical protein